jgi:hypothetical protein
MSSIILSVVMLIVIISSVVMLIVIIPNVFELIVLAPFKQCFTWKNLKIVEIFWTTLAQ